MARGRCESGGQNQHGVGGESPPQRPPNYRTAKKAESLVFIESLGTLIHTVHCDKVPPL
jgi:hypothetical protein